MPSGISNYFVGAQLAAIMGGGLERIVNPRPTPIGIMTPSPECIGTDLRNLNGSNGAASGNYPAANVAIFLPFGIADPMTVVKLWVLNGTAVAGNVDMGIFLPDGTMVVGKGSTAQAGISIQQELDITDTRLDPGRYYLGLTSDTSGATQKVFSWTIPVSGFGSACGVLQAAQGPALASVTFATFAQLNIPYMGLSTRTLIV